MFSILILCSFSATIFGPYRAFGFTNGDIYFGDGANYKVRVYRPSTDKVYLYAGTGVTGTSAASGPATSTPMKAPYGIWGDVVGNMHICDSTGNDYISFR